MEGFEREMGRECTIRGKGLQYCCDKYVKPLEHHELKISMTGN
jgi:hypothetical protein